MKRFTTWKTLALALATVSLGALTAKADDMQWSATWTADPVGSTGIVLPGTQTIRDIISPRRGGNMVQLHLTNREGTLPVTFSQVMIGTQQSGATLVPGSNKPFTFAGKAVVTLQPGQDVVSDPLPYPVTSFTKLAISMQNGGLLGIPVASSTHSVSRETNYYSLVLPLLGGGAAPTSGSGFLPFVLTQGVTFQASWEYISGLDVQTTGAPRTVVAFGDSITDGLTVNPTTDNTFIENVSNLGLEQRYVDFLQQRFNALAQYQSFSVVNAGIAGNRLTAGPFAPFFGPKGLDRLVPDVEQVPGVTDVIMHMGINDIAFDIPAQTLGSHAIGATLENAYATVISQLHAKGIRVILATMMPGKGAGVGMFSPALNTVISTTGTGSLIPPAVNGGALHGTQITDDIRQEVNMWTLNVGAALADGVIDFDACMKDPNNPSFLNPAYNSGDNLHPNATGYLAMANCVNIAKVFPTGQTAAQ